MDRFGDQHYPVGQGPERAVGCSQFRPRVSRGQTQRGRYRAVGDCARVPRHQPGGNRKPARARAFGTAGCKTTLLQLPIDQWGLNLGDDRLVRNGNRHFNQSRLPDGLACSRYPSNVPQIIPTCSLRWINILYDYWMCRDDPQFVLEHLPAALSTLGWFEQKAQRRIEGTILLPRDL